ncbi:hypothetical protein [Nostoc sp.]|uniref:hypothetical protein n=1 Tax=Nostoc sp. TaxID=1180 RepID=UPI002FF90246
MKQPKGNLGKIINNNKSRQLSDSQQDFMLGIFGVGITELEIKYRREHLHDCPKEISVNPDNSCVKLQMQI